MEKKNCLNCQIEFEPINFRGSEQIYCTTRCRNIASQKRKETNLINKIKEEYEPKQISAIPTTTHNNYNQNGEGNYSPKQYGNHISTDILRLMENNFETKIAVNKHELKIEQLEKELMEHKAEILELENELTELENKVPEKGIVGELMHQFKTDPINTLNFAKGMMGDIFKS